MPKWAIGQDVWNAAFGSGRIVAIDDTCATIFVSATAWEIKIQSSLLLPVFGPAPFIGPLDAALSPEESPKENCEEEWQQDDSAVNTETGSAARETKPAPKRPSRSRQLQGA